MDYKSSYFQMEKENGELKIKSHHEINWNMLFVHTWEFHLIDFGKDILAIMPGKFSEKIWNKTKDTLEQNLTSPQTELQM